MSNVFVKIVKCQGSSSLRIRSDYTRAAVIQVSNGTDMKNA